VIRQVLFELSYLIRRTPWDTGISPPELMVFLGSHSPGRALDLGCGTGTNAITMTKHGWQVVAVDISILAIRRARQKAHEASAAIDFRQGDVTAMRNLGDPFDLALDIGCFHSLSGDARKRYAANLKRWLNPEGSFLLYAWLDDEDETQDDPLNAAEIETLFSPELECLDATLGTERQRTSAWFTFRRKP
jgi:cyclopropane fatty-acyl-phospholipid synthase-like methyltransferase